MPSGADRLVPKCTGLEGRGGRDEGGGTLQFGAYGDILEDDEDASICTAREGRGGSDEGRDPVGFNACGGILEVDETAGCFEDDDEEVATGGADFREDRG